MSFNAIITADVRGLETGVDKAGQAIDKLAKSASEKIANIGKSFEDVGKKASIFSAGMVAAGAAIFALTKKTGDFASSLLSASVALDATTDMMQQYKLVAIEASTSADAFDRSTEALVRRLKDVNTEGDNTGDIIRRLGVSLTDASGGMRKTGDVSDDVIKSLADMSNASERNILASQLFGRSWVELAPILDMGSEAIENIKGSANDLGIVLGEDSLNAANNFNVAVEKMKLQAEAMAMQLGARLAPVLQDNILPLIQDHIIPAIVNFADKIAGLAEWFGNLEPSTKKLIGTIGGVALAIGPVLLMLGKVIAIAPAVGAAVTAMTGPIGVIVMAVAAAVAAIIHYWDDIKAYFTEGAGASTFTSISKAATKVKDILIKVFTTIKDVVTKIWDKFGGYITGAFSAVFDTIKAIVDWFIEQVGNVADFFSAIVDGDFSGALDALGNMFTTTFNAILRIVTNIIGQAANIVAGLFDAIGMDKWAAKTKGFADNMIAAYQPVVEETEKATKETEKYAKAQKEAATAAERTAVAVATIARESNIEPIVGAGITMLEVEPVVMPPIDYDPYAQSLEEMNAITLDYGGLISSGLSDFASSVGEAFAEGNFEGLGSGLLGAMGGMISQFGAMLISAGVAAVSLKKLIINPLTAIAAGAALVALGAAATASAKATVSKTTGGGGGGSMGGTNSYNRTSSLGDSSYRGAYRDEWDSKVVFKIGNNELTGVLEQDTRRRERLG